MVGLNFAPFGPIHEFTLGLGGDLMLNAITPSEKPWTGIAPDIRRPDVFLANLEIPLTDEKAKTLRKSAAELKARSQFVLKADPKHAAFMAAAGFDLVSLANNHGMDYGPNGNRQMRRALEAAKIHFAGAGDNAAEAMAFSVITLKDGTRIGLFSALAFLGRGALLKTTPARLNAPGVNVLNFNARIDDSAKSRIKRIVANGHRVCDFLVIGLHWGIERKPVPAAYQVELGRAFAASGANLVWGHHPHVLQGAELYSGVPILYSMGNLISPTPALSGIIHIRVREGHIVRSFFQPVIVRGGNAASETGPAGKASRAKFAELCRKFHKIYPSPLSKPLRI